METASGLSIVALVTALASGPAFAGDVTNLPNDSVDGLQGTITGDAGTFSDVSDVSVVSVRDAVRDFDANAFSETLSGHSPRVADLHDGLRNNSALSDDLGGNDISLSHVVALDNSQDGSLVIDTNSDK